MYLSGTPYENMMAARAAESSRTVTGYQTVRNMSADSCRTQGGTPVNCRTEAVKVGLTTRQQSVCDCSLPVYAPAPAPAPAPAQVTVAPTITTQVSPQVSPVFQQQFQPQNSPATAGTTQTQAAPPAYSAPAPPRPMPGVTSQSALPPAPAPSVPVSVPEYSAPPAPEQLPLAPPDTGTVSTSAPAPTPLFDWKIVAIIGAGLVGVMALSKRK